MGDRGASHRLFGSACVRYLSMAGNGGAGDSIARDVLFEFLCHIGNRCGSSGLFG